MIYKKIMKVHKTYRSIGNILKRVNCPCSDNGRMFTKNERIQKIRQVLNKKGYCQLKGDGLSLIYNRKDFSEDIRSILISSHIDSSYLKFFYKRYSHNEIIGTLDNSICNAILLNLMVKKVLPKNILFAFTGNEEDECLGADETVKYLRNCKKKLWTNLELVISLDVTSEGYGEMPFTIENYFTSNNSKLRFDSQDALKKYLKNKLSNYKNVKFISDKYVDPDESCKYSEYDLNCFSFCLPSKPHPDNKNRETSDWMHSNKGIIIEKDAIEQYSQALSCLIKEICNDIA